MEQSINYPKRKREYNHLELDLKRIVENLKNVKDDDRKYCKLVILKYYDILCATFNRYCIIGGDKDWLSHKGWTQFYKDAYIYDKKSEFCKDKQCSELFNKILKVHDNKNHSKNMTSSWNGIWKKSSSDNDNAEEQDWKMIFKVKQMSDYKLKGYIRSFEYCDIDGIIKITKIPKPKNL